MTDAKNPLVLVAALQTLFCTAPGLIMSLAGALDQDPVLKMLLAPEAHAAIVTPASPAALMYELAMNAIVVNSFGLYRAYVNGAKEQPMVVAMTGIAKVAASMLFLRMYLIGVATVAVIPAVVFPDLALGIYFLLLWSKMGFTTQTASVASAKKES